MNMSKLLAGIALAGAAAVLLAACQKQQDAGPAEALGNKIDGAVALITAMGRALVSEGPRSSVYDERGVLSF